MRLILTPLALLCAAGLVLGAGAAPETGDRLAPPVRIECADGAINVDVGHAAPYVHDWNSDGLADLLVGQFGEGKLRIYLNTGTKKAPKFGKFEWFQAGGANGTVPSG